MTVAFVLACPMGFAAQIERNLPPKIAPFERALVVGADSRFSFLDQSPTFDRGAKVWHLEAGVSAVFAGLVDSAERGLSSLRGKLASSSGRSVEEIARLAKESFQTSVPSRRRRSDATSVLVAVRSLQEMAVIRLDSVSNFEPYISGHGEIIGDSRACAAFDRQIRARVATRESVTNGQTERREVISNSSILHDVAAVSLKAAIQEIGGTVGGPLQIAILNARGTETRSVLALDFDPDVRRGGQQPRIERINARQEELRGSTGRDVSRLLPMGLDDSHESIVGIQEGADGRLYLTKKGWIARR